MSQARGRSSEKASEEECKYQQQQQQQPSFLLGYAHVCSRTQLYTEIRIGHHLSRILPVQRILTTRFETPPSPVLS